MYRYLITILLFAIFGSCALAKKHRIASTNPLHQVMQLPELQHFAQQRRTFEIQIIYTQIDRDKNQTPHFTSWHWGLDSTRYFYPASTVKLPIALMALEKIHSIRTSGYPKINSETPYYLDSLQPHQSIYRYNPDAPHGKPSIAQDVRAIFGTSDNEASNHLFDFLGRTAINAQLGERGFHRTGLLHRFNAGQRNQQYAPPIYFYDAQRTLFKEPEKFDKQQWVNPQKGLLKGKSYMDSSHELVQKPFDFTHKNWFALTDMEMMLRSALFHRAMPAEKQFQLAPEDFRLLHRAMGAFPREFDYPKYAPEQYPDNYVKFLLFGDAQQPLSGQIRSFNKSGMAYGTLTDIAYIVDFEHQAEFILVATIYCNQDGILNDDRYDYEKIGIPFLAALGKAVLEYDSNRERNIKPDLEYWKNLF